MEAMYAGEVWKTILYPVVGVMSRRMLEYCPFQNSVNVSCLQDYNFESSFWCYEIFLYPITIFPSAVAVPVATNAEQCAFAKDPGFLGAPYLL